MLFRSIRRRNSTSLFHFIVSICNKSSDAPKYLQPFYSVFFPRDTREFVISFIRAATSRGGSAGKGKKWWYKSRLAEKSFFPLARSRCWVLRKITEKYRIGKSIRLHLLQCYNFFFHYSFCYPESFEFRYRSRERREIGLARVPIENNSIRPSFAKSFCGSVHKYEKQEPKISSSRGPAHGGFLSIGIISSNFARTAFLAIVFARWKAPIGHAKIR